MQTYSSPYLNWYLNQGNMFDCYGNYGCSYSTGEAIGLGVTSALGQLGSIFAVRYAMNGSGGGGGSKVSTANTERANIQNDIDAQLDILGDGYNIDNYETAKVEEKYDTDIKTAQTNINKVKNDTKTKQDELDKIKKDLPGKKAELSGLNDKIEAIKSDPNKATELQELRTQYNKLEQEINELETKQTKLEKEIEENNKKVAENGELGKALKAANDAKTNREKEIADAITEIKALEEDLEKIKTCNNPDEMNEVLDDADGNWIQRKFKGERGDLMQKVREFRKAKLEYDKIPNDDVHKSAKENAKEKLKTKATEIDTAYNSCSDKARADIDKDATLQAGLQTIKDWANANK